VIAVISEYFTRNNSQKKMGLFECHCGKIFKAIHSMVINKRTKSCGCLTTTHNKSNNPEYRIWIDIKRRCLDPRVKGYTNYGAKGITVSEAWLSSFENFYRDMGPRPGPDYSIDRIDNNNGYCKDNCRWATDKQQNNNRGTFNKLLEFNGKVQTQSQWAQELGMNDDTFHRRLKRGWSVEKTITTKLRSYK